MNTLSNTKHWIHELSDSYPLNVALITPVKRFSYKEYFEKSVSIASFLSDTGIKEKNHVGILFNHKTDFAFLVNAIWLLNAVPVPLNSRNRPEEISNQLQQADIKFLLVDSSYNEFDFEKLSLANSSVTIIHIDFTNIKSSKKSLQFYHFCTDNSALLLFTSGSSGKSKVVVHSFKNLFEHVNAMNSSFQLSNDDLWFASLPLYHIGGFMILVRALLSASAVAFPNSLKQNDLIYGMNKYSPTHISFVATMLQRIMDNKGVPARNIKYVFLGGGPLSSSLCRNAISIGWPIIKVYGSTETCAMVSALRTEDFNHKGESAGKPIGENEIQIKDGEILIQSKSLFNKYYNDDQATNTVLIDGYYYSGDYGRIDEDGFLFVDSRREDTIITGGENVSVNEIEIVLKSFGSVIDAFVFPQTDETWGQIICAAVVSKDIIESGLRESLRKKLPSYKIPKQFYFVSEIPRNEMGKIKRNELYKLLSLSET